MIWDKSRQDNMRYNQKPGEMMMIKWNMNIEKTHFMLFTPKDFSRNMDCISIDGHRIEEVKQTKFLGVILDNKLNSHAHCEYICGKISKGICIIIKAQKVFNDTTLLSLYNSLILPYLSYCIHVWGKAYDTHLKHVMVLRNKAARVIAGVPPRTNADMLIISIWNLMYFLSKNLCLCF